MEHCRAAERALVAALVMGQVDPSELAGRLDLLDFTDPAAAACYAAVLDHEMASGPLLDLPERLRRRAALRSDGYPIRELLEWLPSLPVPAHPEAWAALVVAGSLGRVVHASGTRLVQSTVSLDGTRPEAGRVLTVAAAQRAALHGALRRWDALPSSWRDTVPRRSAQPSAEPVSPVSVDPTARVLEQEVLAGVVAAPALLDRVPWLRAGDFTDPGVAEVFGAVRELHGAGRPVDLVTLSANLSLTDEPGTAHGPDIRSGSAAAVCAELRPKHAVLASVPFLARRLVEDAAVRQAHRTGLALVMLAGAPGSAGGLGRPLLEAAVRHLDGLRPYAERLEQAHRPLTTRSRDTARSRDVGWRGPDRLAGSHGTVDVRHAG